MLTLDKQFRPRSCALFAYINEKHRDRMVGATKNGPMTASALTGHRRQFPVAVEFFGAVDANPDVTETTPHTR